MIIRAKIETSEKFSYKDKRYVKIAGYLEGRGLFEQTVREELIPDNLEGKTCEIEFAVGLSHFKPYLKIDSIKVL